MRPDSIQALLELHPRTRLVAGPTPLVSLPRLRGALGPETPDLMAKLDEETGFGLGGNKVRKLEYELSPPRLRGVTHLVTTGGPQSNHCRVTAAAAARLGLGCVLVINGEVPDPPTGNALLQLTLGAKIRNVASRAERGDAMETERQRIAESGGKALLIPLGASSSLGALGYVRAALELHDQIPPKQDRDVHVVLSSSSGGTLAGLVAGVALLDRPDVHLWAVSADTPGKELLANAIELAGAALERLDMDPGILEGMTDRVDASDDEVGSGYGIPTDASREAADLFARSEGMIVDPVYTSKAAAGMIRWIGRGAFSPEIVSYSSTPVVTPPSSPEVPIVSDTPEPTLDPAPFLARIPTFRDLDPPRLEKLAERCSILEFGEDEVLAQTGEPGSTLYIVASGEVQVGTGDDDDGATPRRLVSGEAFGETALLSGAPWRSTIVAPAGVTVVELTREDFEDAVAEDPGLSLMVMKGLALRLHRPDQGGGNLRDRAMRDSLTGLLNRRSFRERLAEECDRTRRYGEPFSLVVLDIDHFDRLNEEYGQEVGDQVLAWLGRIVGENTRTADSAYRIGGEEFAVICPSSEGDVAAAAGRRLVDVVADTPPPLDFQLSVTLSAGYASAPTDARRPDALFHLADRALLKAKAEGRNRVSPPHTTF